MRPPGSYAKKMDEKKINCQLVPPHIHRRNADKRAIRTFKNNLSLVWKALTRNFLFIVGHIITTRGNNAESPKKIYNKSKAFGRSLTQQIVQI